MGLNGDDLPWVWIMDLGRRCSRDRKIRHSSLDCRIDRIRLQYIEAKPGLFAPKTSPEAEPPMKPGAGLRIEHALSFECGWRTGHHAVRKRWEGDLL